jgi:Fe2+ transport system protein FeoA
MSHLTDSRGRRDEVAFVFGFPRSRPEIDGAATPATSSSLCDSCPLALCAVGCQATVLGISCHAHDAQRLRSLGLFEGARVGIIDTRSGMVLDVRGSRLALGWEIAAGITVCLVSA